MKETKDITEQMIEKLKEEIEEKAKKKTPPEYKKHRKNIYAELESLLKIHSLNEYERHYPVILHIINLGLDESEDIEQKKISKELWEFKKAIEKRIEKKNSQLTEKYPEFNNIPLNNEMHHPFLNQPLKSRPTEIKTNTIKSLGNYLKDYFPEKTKTSKKIAEIFHYFYGEKTYPEGNIDPENIRKMI